MIYTILKIIKTSNPVGEWERGLAIVLGNFQCRDVLVGKEYTVPAICASGGCLDFCSLAYLPIISFFFTLSERRQDTV